MYIQVIEHNLTITMNTGVVLHSLVMQLFGLHLGHRRNPS